MSPLQAATLCQLCSSEEPQPPLKLVGICAHVFHKACLGQAVTCPSCHQDWTVAYEGEFTDYHQLLVALLGQQERDEHLAKQQEARAQAYEELVRQQRDENAALEAEIERLERRVGEH